MLTQTLVMQAGGTVQFIDIGNFVRVLEAQNAITLRTYKSGQVKTESEGVYGGFAEQFQDEFEKVEIYSATAQTVQVVIRLGSIVSYDVSPTGNVNVTNPVALDAATLAALETVNIGNVNGAFNQGRASVTNANQVLIAANANRRYLMLQNNDAAAVLRVTLDGNAATAAQGFRVQPGGALDIPAYAVTGAISCMMETATAAAGNVEYVEA